MPTLITARRLLTDIGSIEYPVITVADDGTLDDISSDPIALEHETDILTAAFLDIHTHGALGHDVMSATPAELSAMQRFLAGHGVAHYLPTTVTASIDSTLRALDALAHAIESPRDPVEARPIGIHLEGPFLSHAKRGVHPADQLQPPSIELFDRFYEAARGHISLVTIAPERHAWTATRDRTTTAGAALKATGFSPANHTHDEGAPAPQGTRALASSAGAALKATGFSPANHAPDEGAPAAEGSSALELIAHATARGVRVSVGHSNATAAETHAAVTAGATSATHTFNAMRPLDHREPGVVGVTLDDSRLFAELICDGIHVAPELIRIWLNSKSADRAILVTDAMSAAGMPDGVYKLGSLDVQVANGRAVLAGDLAYGKETLAGSVLTMDRAVANLQRFAHASLADATRCASHTPAAMLGRPELTRLAPGSPANLNRFDSNGRLIATWIRGELVS